jgi:hypothetical protein
VVNVANRKKAMRYFQEGTSKLSEPLFGTERKATACQEVVEVINVGENKRPDYVRIPIQFRRSSKIDREKQHCRI